MIRELPLELSGRRVLLRPLRASDFEQWREVRRRCRDWLTRWEPKPAVGQPDVVEDPKAFAARCGSRDRERQLGSGYGFGIFVGDRFAGEINLNSVQRGPFQNAYVGYWVDQALAGNGYVPEATVVAFRFGFEDLGLHRFQVAIIPRNVASRRVVAKLGLRDEGTAVRYLQINGRWEDHVRYAITAEEWAERGDGYLDAWVRPQA
ncbi:MAG: GNAT family N-acetyltransferase [Actinomycetota bacterium]|nr:GNAT family N-acetyltransferase [Actinomycetota bacterium]